MAFPPFDRRTVLGVSIAALVPGFALTHTVVSRYRTSRERLATEWSVRGHRDLAVAPEKAVVDFETALSYGPDRPDDRFELAEALIQAREPVEARAQLLTLWAEQPGSGRINLELARLAAADGDVREAVRYYHGAVDGSWESGASNARRAARLEAAKLLLAHGERLRAQSELIALIDDLPADSALMTRIAGLLVDAGADLRARTLLDRALTIDPQNRAAARLAGTIAFRRGDYPAASSYFRTANASDPDATRMLAVSEAVLALDPYSRGLSRAERATRAQHSLEAATDRLRRCETGAGSSTTPSPFDDLDKRVAAARKLRARTLARDPEALDDVMALVFEIEKRPDAACGPPDARDRALLILAERSGRPQ